MDRQEISERTFSLDWFEKSAYEDAALLFDDRLIDQRVDGLAIMPAKGAGRR
jgi:hypothetical protein